MTMGNETKMNLFLKYVSHFLIGLGLLLVLYGNVARLIMPSAYIAVGEPLSKLETEVFCCCNAGYLFVVFGLIIKIYILKNKVITH